MTTMAYTGERLMNNTKYQIAGWLAITSVMMMAPSAGLAFLFDMKPDQFAMVLPYHFGLEILGLVLGCYALYQFKNFLNEYDFHRVDTLVILVIIGSVLLTGVGLAGRIYGATDHSVAEEEMIMKKLSWILAIVAVGTPLSIIGIIFSVQLLKLRSTLGGLLKPIAYTYMAASICFITVVLAPIGLLLVIISTILMAIVMIRGPEVEPESEEVVEFV